MLSAASTVANGNRRPDWGPILFFKLTFFQILFFRGLGPNLRMLKNWSDNIELFQCYEANQKGDSRSFLIVSDDQIGSKSATGEAPLYINCRQSLIAADLMY